MKTQILNNNIFSYISLRQEYSNTKLVEAVRSRCISQRLPQAIQENELIFGNIDKIFAAQWLDELHVICGTKCNKLLVQNVISKQLWEIPTLKGSGTTPFPEKNCGIHSISINPSSTRLATGAQNPNGVAFYKLPGIEPIAVGEFHTDWLFSSSWITDDVIATGSRDKCLAFWVLKDNDQMDNAESSISFIKPAKTIERNKTLDKVRAMTYNSFYENLTTITSNGFVHIWDVNNFTQIVCHSLPFSKENVCIAHEKTNLLYAVGSLSHVSLLETRSARAVGSLCSTDQGAGVRSVSFNDTIVTIGTGYGSILFYDIRVNKMLENVDGVPFFHRAGRGWLRRDSVFREFFWETECYPNAVYAHSYQPTTMKLLTVGGPLALGLYGNYAAYWD
ncbi:DDB1- and CUL4-associated factor 12 isoform X3 [Hydra vulgaris]|uniref:DDB1- and CUL4-associated factor 12 isoform X3 n=1 Tax=Hydra vulgaris TaxID=6087 RepID=A0ABM4DEN0_HYDVU